MGPGGPSKRTAHARYYLRGWQMAPDEGMLGLRVASPATGMQV